MAKRRISILTSAAPPARSEANVIDPLSHQTGKTAAMLKLEAERADPPGAVTSRSAQAFGRLDPKSSVCILPPF
jgi:hypothetical protein